MRLAQAGSGGPIRPLVVMYHIADHTLVTRAVNARTTVVQVSLVPSQGGYRRFDAKNPRLKDIQARFTKQLGVTAFWPIVLVGWSEGCQGIRQQIPPEPPDEPPSTFISGVLALDGLHSSQPPHVPSQIMPWVRWFLRCGADFTQEVGPNIDLPLAVVTMTQITPPDYPSVRETVETITSWGHPGPGWTIPPGSSLSDPNAQHSGNLSVVSYPGADSKAHMDQARVALPDQLSHMARYLGFGPSSEQSKATIQLPTPSQPMGGAVSKAAAKLSTYDLKRLVPLALIGGSAAARWALKRWRLV